MQALVDTATDVLCGAIGLVLAWKKAAFDADDALVCVFRMFGKVCVEKLEGVCVGRAAGTEVLVSGAILEGMSVMAY